MFRFLFELLTNTPPFVGETLPELQSRVLSGAPERLTAHRPDAPPGLEAGVGKCLQKDLANRDANVTDLAGAPAPRKLSPHPARRARCATSGPAP